MNLTVDNLILTPGSVRSGMSNLEVGPIRYVRIRLRT